MMAEGRFREDLYYRLNEVAVRVPPLRERLGDPVVMASFFLRRFASEYGRPIRGFASAALAAINDHPWPGNVRELDHTMERAVLMAQRNWIAPADLGLNAQRSASQSLDDMSLEAVEAILIRKALARAEGNVSRAADALGLSRGALYRRIEKYGL